MQTKYLWALLLLVSLPASSQITLSGNIQDNYGFPIEDVRISTSKDSTYSNAEGNYSLNLPSSGNIRLVLEKGGFQRLEAKFYIEGNQTRNFILNEELVEFSEMVIQHAHEKKIENAETLNAQFLKEEFSGSFAKSLEKIPGIQAMEIGSGTPKPVIRGRGFNRISVVDNGIKQE